MTGNFSDLLFQWGELPSALAALLAPLLYLQAVKWILRDDRFAVAGLAAGFIGVLAGLLVDAVPAGAQAYQPAGRQKQVPACRGQVHEHRTDRRHHGRDAGGRPFGPVGLLAVCARSIGLRETG